MASAQPPRGNAVTSSAADKQSAVSGATSQHERSHVVGSLAPVADPAQGELFPSWASRPAARPRIWGNP